MTKEDRLIRKEIVERFGEAVIKKAKGRLCSQCSRRPCHLYPIEADGSDCSYFKLKELKT